MNNHKFIDYQPPKTKHRHITQHPQQPNTPDPVHTNSNNTVSSTAKVVLIFSIIPY